MSITKITIYNSTTSSYQDLSAVFLPLSSGTQSEEITYFNVSGTDLRNIFASISSPGGSDIGYNTNLLVNGTDLRYIFASINSKSLFNTTSGLLTTDNGYNDSRTLASNFYISSSYSYFNFILYGGGGSGSQVGTGYGTGGGGAGSYISASNIPYSTSSGVTIQKITYTISGGRSGGSDFNTTVTITYSNVTSIVLNAGSGESTNANSGTAGALGGIASFTNNTTATSITVTKQNGASGGNEGSNGTSNGYTSSGSGSNTKETAPYSNPPTVSKTYNTPDGNSYTIESRGGGISQTTYQYGAGGAATPANYKPNPTDSATDYRYGVAGCILYWLS